MEDDSTYFLNQDYSDTDDEDYVPEAHVSSDEEPLPDVPESNELNDVESSSGGGSSKSPEKDVEKDKASEAKRADEIFKQFLAEVEIDMKAQKNESIGIPSTSSIQSSPSVQSSSSDKADSVFEFAGEAVTVPKDMNLDDFMSPGMKKKAIPSAAPAMIRRGPAPKKKGIESVLDAIASKRLKMSTLNKSKLDWQSYKKEKKIDQEISTFNRGKAGYIERKKFLERADARSYEIERDARLSRNKKK